MFIPAECVGVSFLSTLPKTVPVVDTANSQNEFETEALGINHIIGRNVTLS